MRRPPRACPSFALLLWRIRSGYTTERDAWRVLSLLSRIDRAEGEANWLVNECRRLHGVLAERNKKIDALRERVCVLEEFIWAEGPLPEPPARYVIEGADDG